MKSDRLYLCDRRSDMVISGGVNIYPSEIEQMLVQCPGVRDCAVFGIPDEDLGETLMAVVEPAPDGIEKDFRRADCTSKFSHGQDPWRTSEMQVLPDAAGLLGRSQVALGLQFFRLPSR
jgi:acyl-CoA synthetase (AMP-forming)/AMP-acid ligase II